jgi:hypothetical protein
MHKYLTHYAHCHILVRKTKGPSSAVCADFIRKRHHHLLCNVCALRIAGSVGTKGGTKARAPLLDLAPCYAEQSRWTTNWSREPRTEEVVFGSRTGICVYMRSAAFPTPSRSPPGESAVFLVSDGLLGVRRWGRPWISC